MKTHKIGTFSMVHRNVDVYVNPDDASGWFSYFPNNQHKGNAQMCIGINGTVTETTETLLHESLELALNDLRCRYVPSNGISRGNDDYLFIFSHPQLSEACARAAGFQGQALLPVLLARKKLHSRK